MSAEKFVLVCEIRSERFLFGAVRFPFNPNQVVLKGEFSITDDTSLASLLKQSVEASKAQEPNGILERVFFMIPTIQQQDILIIPEFDWSFSRQQLEGYLGLPVTLIDFATSILRGANSFPEIAHATIQTGETESSKGLIRSRVVIDFGRNLRVVRSVSSSSGTFYETTSSEHLDFCDFDEESKAFREYIIDAIGLNPEYEMCASELGLRNLFYFMLEKGEIDKFDPVIIEILRLPESTKWKSIARDSTRNASLTKLVDRFIALCSRFIMNVAAALNPSDGLFLTGELVSAFWNRFTVGNELIAPFELHANPFFQRELKSIPIHALEESNLFFLGAAGAASIEASSD